MSVRVVEQWLTMYEAVPTLASTHLSYPATVRPVQVTMERKRDPSQRRWRGRWLHPDGSLFMEDWIHPQNFRRYFYASEVEAWEGLLQIERERLAHFRERLAQTEREVGELEQQVRFKRWRAEQEDTER
jgi:hypothetical protein